MFQIFVTMLTVFLGLGHFTQQSSAVDDTVTYYPVLDNGDIFMQSSSDPQDRYNLSQNAAQDYSPVLSSDGRRVAFVSERDGNPEIYIADLDQYVANRWLILFSPSIWADSYTYRVTESAADETAPSWSRDGTQLTFESNIRHNYDIYIAQIPQNLNRGSYTIWNVTRSSTDEHNPYWVSEQRIGFFTHQNGIMTHYQIDTDGSNMVLIPPRDEDIYCG